MPAKLPSSRWGVAGVAALSGALAALGQAPWGLWWLSLPCFAGLFWSLRQAETTKRAAWIGWAGGAGYFAIALFWIVEPFLVDIGRHGWMAPFALFFMAGGFALFWGLAFGSAHRLGGHRKTFLAVIMLTGVELLRGVILTGFPWAMIGHIWADTPWLLLASYMGAVGLTFFTALVAALPVMLRPVWGLAIAAALMGAGWLEGARLMSREIPPTAKTVRLVQPNIAQHLKWDPDEIPVSFGRLLAITAEPPDAPLDLIIWPETSLASRLDRADIALAAISNAAGPVPVVIGANAAVMDPDSAAVTYRNTMGVLDASGQLAQTYYKHHLVPFGEYVPMGELLSKIGIRGLAARDGAGYSAGDGPELIEIDGVGRALPLICYELIFPRHLRTAERPDFIMQITNDAWFGNISGPYQHLAQARLRAVEQGLGLVRAANTGVSAVIDPNGRVIRSAPLNEAGYVDAAIPQALPAPPYAKMGDTPLGVGLLLIFALTVRWRNYD